MREKMFEKRKALLFIALSALLPRIFDGVLSVIVSSLANPTVLSEGVGATVMGFFKGVFWLVTVYAFGKALTKNNRNALLFIGSVSFAAAVVNILLFEFIETAAHIMQQIGVISADVYAYLTFATSIITALASIYPAYYFLTAVLGMNERYESKSLENSALDYPKAIRFGIINIVAMIVISSAVTLIPALIHSFVYSFSNAISTAIMTYIPQWLSLTAPTLVMCFVGYMTCKSTFEMIIFCVATQACSAISNVISGVTSIGISVTSLIAKKGWGDLLVHYSLVGILSVISIVISVVILVKGFRYFFKNKNEQVFADAT